MEPGGGGSCKRHCTTDNQRSFETMELLELTTIVSVSSCCFCCAVAWYHIAVQLSGLWSSISPPINQEVAAGGHVVSGRGQQSVSKQPPAEFSQETEQDTLSSAFQPSPKPPSVQLKWLSPKHTVSCARLVYAYAKNCLWFQSLTRPRASLLKSWIWTWTCRGGAAAAPVGIVIVLRVSEVELRRCRSVSVQVSGLGGGVGLRVMLQWAWVRMFGLHLPTIQRSDYKKLRGGCASLERTHPLPVALFHTSSFNHLITELCLWKETCYVFLIMTLAISLTLPFLLLNP